MLWHDLAISQGESPDNSLAEHNSVMEYAGFHCPIGAARAPSDTKRRPGYFTGTPSPSSA
jgi:hypothetical protein